MSKPFTTEPIDLDGALLNPGGEEKDTHPENELNVIHDYSQIKFSPIELSITEKLTNLIKGYYQSPIGEYPLTEFYYQVTDTHILIFDRKGGYLLEAGIGSFTLDEIDWILQNLPIYNNGEEHQDTSQIHLDFREIRKDGWMVFRRSGTYVQLIGWIRKNLSHIYQTPSITDYYFEERIDRTEVSSYELDVIHKFIQNTIPTIDVTNIIVDYTSIQMLVGESIPVTVSVHPYQATDKSLDTSIDTTIATFEENIVKGISEGFTTLSLTSISNPDVEVQIPIEVIQFREIISSRYDIIDGNDLYGYENKYIITIEPGETILDVLNSLENIKDNIVVKDIYEQEYVPEVYSDTVITTGMRLTLIVHGIQYDEVTLIIRGDINNDGFVNEWDKQLIRDYVNGYMDLSVEQIMAADVNNDGVVDLDDLGIIDRYIKGEISSLNNF